MSCLFGSVSHQPLGMNFPKIRAANSGICGTSKNFSRFGSVVEPLQNGGLYTFFYGPDFCPPVGAAKNGASLCLSNVANKNMNSAPVMFSRNGSQCGITGFITNNIGSNKNGTPMTWKPIFYHTLIECSGCSMGFTQH